MVTLFRVRRMIVVALVIAMIVLSGIVTAYIALKPASLASTPGYSQSPAVTPSPTTTSQPSISPSPTPTISTPNPTSTSTPTPPPAPTSSPTPTPSPSPTPEPTPIPTPSPMPATHTVDYTTMMQQNENDYWNISVTRPYTVMLNDSMTVSSGDQYLQVVGLTGDINNTWEVLYQNSTYFQYITWDDQGNQIDSGWLNCDNGIVQITVTDASITFTGTTSFTSPIPFVDLGQIWTANADGIFDGGELDMTLTIT
jgi:hypothetical protein